MLKVGGELSQLKSLDLGGYELRIDPFARNQNESVRELIGRCGSFSV
jgi:hypothetical protein